MSPGIGTACRSPTSASEVYAASTATPATTLVEGIDPRPPSIPGSAPGDGSCAGNAHGHSSRPGSNRSATNHTTSIGPGPATALKKDDTSSKAATEVKEFFEEQESAVLTAWLRHFDVNNDQRISLSEFIRGMRKLNFAGDVVGLFKSIDTDRSGELSLEEIDETQASHWQQFRDWCVLTFTSSEDMLMRLANLSASTAASPSGGKSRSPAIPEVRITIAQFKQGLKDHGWLSKWGDDVLFNAIDVQDKQSLGRQELAWLDTELARKLRKDEAKKRAYQEMAKGRKPNWKLAALALADFKQFLKKKYGNYLRAWRVALCPDTSMTIRKSDLFKACSKIGWQGDVRLLYKAFDADDSGFVSIEELDARSAEILAQFWALVTQKLGGSAEAFRALDKHNVKKLRLADFAEGLKRFGFQHSPKLLFKSLDVLGSRALVEQDLMFLQLWHPPAFLYTRPNARAAEEVKALLVNKYKNNLNAWRQALDTDGSNHCTFSEFERCFKKIGYSGDVAGAWRHLDDDLSGFITLHEIDPEAGDTVATFKRWCDEQFGNIKSAFEVFDDGGNGEVSYREFRRACHIYGFKGDQVKVLFRALDAEGSGALTMDEIAFLDSWEFKDEEECTVDANDSAAAGGEKPRPPQEIGLMEYSIEGPGPANYAPPTTMGAGPEMPMVRHAGSFSFRPRRPLEFPGLSKDTAVQPSTHSYDTRTGLCAVLPSKPSACFSTQQRASNLPVLHGSKQPGPSDYYPVAFSNLGPCASFLPRRRVKVHPLFREMFAVARAKEPEPLRLPPI
mmetsp:Transcript_88057/g.188980  ORF Transcript_88057/g.188980 Transcript_88057/m.188980 type:complete len:788 (-) Transcript_88057:131-2494(-)